MQSIDIKEPFRFAHRGCDVVEYLAGVQEVPDEVAELAIHENWATAAHAAAPENKDDAPRRRGRKAEE